MRVKYNDNYIIRKIKEHDDIFLEKVDNYFIVKDGLLPIFYMLDEYMHFSKDFKSLKELYKVLENEKKEG